MGYIGLHFSQVANGILRTFPMRGVLWSKLVRKFDTHALLPPIGQQQLNPSQKNVMQENLKHFWVMLLAFLVGELHAQNASNEGVILSKLERIFDTHVLLPTSGQQLNQSQKHLVQ